MFDQKKKADVSKTAVAAGIIFVDCRGMYAITGPYWYHLDLCHFQFENLVLIEESNQAVLVMCFGEQIS